MSAILANTPAMLECHYGVPMAGAVLNTINTRLDAAVIAFQLDHGEAKVLIVDREFSKVAKEALSLCKVKPLVVDYDDPEYSGAGDRLGSHRIRGVSSRPAIADFAWRCRATNGTPSRSTTPRAPPAIPRAWSITTAARYLLAIGNVLTGAMGQHPVYLWTLPMFHCNGWCFPWTLSVVAGTHVCLRAVRAKPMYDLIATHKVTHLCGAPIVMSTLAQRAGRGEEAAAARASSSSPPPRRRPKPCSRR